MGFPAFGGESLGYGSPEDYYRTHEEIPNAYERRWHDDQPAAVSILCEAAGMVPMLERAVRPYRIGVLSSGGFDSLTVKHDLFQAAVRRFEEHGQDTVLLHLGDYDPSGESIAKSMQEDFDAFCMDTYRGPLIEVRRVALTEDQVVEYDLPTAPAKESDSRARNWQGSATCQLEAIPPDMLSALLQGAVEDALDMDVLSASKERERQERVEVQVRLDVANAALRDAFGLSM